MTGLTRHVTLDVDAPASVVATRLREAVEPRDDVVEEFVTSLFSGVREVRFIGQVTPRDFRLRTAVRVSWTRQHYTMRVTGVLEPRGERTGVRATIAPGWPLLMLLVLAPLWIAFMLWSARHEALTAVLLCSIFGAVIGLPAWSAYAEAETALRKVLQPEGRGRLAWD